MREEGGKVGGAGEDHAEVDAELSFGSWDCEESPLLRPGFRDGERHREGL